MGMHWTYLVFRPNTVTRSALRDAGLRWSIRLEGFEFRVGRDTAWAAQVVTTGTIKHGQTELPSLAPPVPLQTLVGFEIEASFAQAISRDLDVAVMLLYYSDGQCSVAIWKAGRLDRAEAVFEDPVPTRLELRDGGRTTQREADLRYWAFGDLMLNEFVGTSLGEAPTEQLADAYLGEGDLAVGGAEPLVERDEVVAKEQNYEMQTCCGCGRLLPSRRLFVTESGLACDACFSG